MNLLKATQKVAEPGPKSKTLYSKSPPPYSTKKGFLSFLKYPKEKQGRAFCTSKWDIEFSAGERGSSSSGVRLWQPRQNPHRKCLGSFSVWFLCRSLAYVVSGSWLLKLCWVWVTSHGMALRSDMVWLLPQVLCLYLHQHNLQTGHHGGSKDL